jgi:CCR4-NOT complex subunit CAF16
MTVIVGKTTILKILGGKHMVEPHMVRVLGRSAFHDTTLTSSGDLSYLGGEVCVFPFALSSTI